MSNYDLAKYESSNDTGVASLIQEKIMQMKVLSGLDGLEKIFTKVDTILATCLSKRGFAEVKDDMTMSEMLALGINQKVMDFYLTLIQLQLTSLFKQ